MTKHRVVKVVFAVAAVIHFLAGGHDISFWGCLIVAGVYDATDPNI